MKTQSFAKILACLLMLFAIPAMATVVEINSDQTDYTFLGNTTYFVDANVTLYGTTTFKSGTVLKYNSSGQLNIDSSGTVVCPTNGYPAIFTSMNDDSVGDTIPGSSGTPGIYDIYTDSGTDVNTFLNYSGTLFNMRFSYAYSPLEWYTSATFQNCQFFYDAYMYVQTAQIFNNLFVEVNDLDWFPSADNNTIQNNTFVDCGSVILDGTTGTVTASDNLFDSSQVLDWTDYGSTGGNNAFYNCSDYLGADLGLPTDITLYSEPAYESGPLGDYYLPSDSSLIDAGDMSASDARLNSFTTQADQTPDSGTVDIGYHYSIWHYVVIDSDQTDYTFLSNTTYFIDANITLSGTTTFQSGTILKYNSGGQINLPSDGTVVFPADAEPAIFTSYNDNTVGETVSGSSGTPAAGDVNTFLNVTNVTLSNLHFYYAYSPFQVFAPVALENCEFFYDEDVNMKTLHVFNNLFVDVTEVDWYPSGDVYDPEADDGFPDYFNDNLMVNNTFVNSYVILDYDGFNDGEVWVFDNLFDTTEAVDFTFNYDSLGGDNAFYNASDGLAGSGLPGDFTLSSDPDFQTGPLGDYYLPSDSPLIDAGAVNVGDLGISYLFPSVGTTQTNQTTDSGTIDIGYHYLVVQ